MVLVLGLLLTGSLYAAFAPAQAEQAELQRRPGREGPRALPRRLRLLPRPERRGHQHPGRQPDRPVARRRRRRRGRLPGRHRPDADGPAGRAGPAQEAGRTPTRRSPRSRRTSPRSAPARRSRPRPTTASRASATRSARRPSPAAARSSSPTAPPATTSRAPAARCRAAATPRRSAASTPKYIYEAMLTGPQAMDNFSNGNLSPEEKRDVIAYLGSARRAARLRRLRPRRPRPGERGPVRLARRHRRAGRLRRLDRRPHHALDQEEGGSVSDHDNLPDDHGPRRTREDEPIANPGLPPHQWRPTDVDPQAEKRAERQVAALFGSRCSARSCSSSPTSSSTIGDRPGRPIGGLGASNVALGVTLGVALLLHRRRHDPVGPQAHGRPRDRRDAPPAPPPRRGPRRHVAAARRRASRSPASAAARWSATRCSAPSASSACPPIVMLRDLGPLPGDKLDHTSGSTGMRVVRDVVGTPDQGLRPRDRRPGQRRAGGALRHRRRTASR